MSARFSVVVSSLTLALTMAMWMPLTASAQAAKGQTVNAKMGPALKAALDAARNKQYDVALAKVKEAEAEKKTPFENYKINETLAYIYGQQKKYTDLAATYEKMLQTPQFVAPEQQQTMIKAIAQSYAAAGGQPAKVIEYGKKWLETHPNDTEMMAYVGQAYYSMKDFKGCQSTFASAISVTEKSSAKPDEKWLEFYLNCSNTLGDDKAEMSAYEKLVRYYQKPQYWSNYLKRVSRADRDDTAHFSWLRLMADTGSLRDADDYIEYAQRAITSYGVACEAVKVLEDGFNKKVLGQEGRDKARQVNTLAKAKEACQADKSRVSQVVSEGESDSTGQKYFDAGMIYFGNAQYDQAISNLEKGMKKGNLKEPAQAGHAKLVVGIAQLKKGDREAARATFKALSSDQTLGRVAAAWTLRSYS